MVPGARVLVHEKAEVVGKTKGVAEGAWVFLGTRDGAREGATVGVWVRATVGVWVVATEGAATMSFKIIDVCLQSHSLYVVIF